MIERHASQVKEKLVWILFLYFFQFYQSYEIKFPTKIYSFTVCTHNHRSEKNKSTCKSALHYVK